MADAGLSRGGFVAAVCSDLEPFRWRSFAPQTVARHVVGAVDGHCVAGLLEATSDPLSAGWGHVAPADRSDERVGVLVGFLSEHQWRGWTLPFLARQLLGTLDAWWTSRQRLEVELSRLVSGDG